MKSLCSVKIIWPALRKLLGFWRVFTLFMLLSTRFFKLNICENARITIKHAHFNALTFSRLLKAV